MDVGDTLMSIASVFLSLAALGLVVLVIIVIVKMTG